MTAEGGEAPAKPDRGLGDVVALMRRALIRLNTVEQRLAALEERQHDLDDMAEQIRGMQRLLQRQQGATQENAQEKAQEKVTSRVERLVEQKVNERMNRVLDSKVALRVDKRLAKHALLPGDE